MRHHYNQAFCKVCCLFTRIRIYRLSLHIAAICRHVSEEHESPRGFQVPAESGAGEQGQVLRQGGVSAAWGNVSLVWHYVSSLYWQQHRNAD